MSIDHTIPCPACDASARADDHGPCDICGGASRIGIPRPDRPEIVATRWLSDDPNMPHPLVVDAFDEVLMHGQMTAIRGILGMTEYRLGTLCGIRLIAIATGMWHGSEMALFEECEAIIGAWHDVAKEIADRRDLHRAERMAREEERPS